MTDETGLRARKKAETRRVIANVAQQLFAERGFDVVTVADVAAAANVSTKTVFNYFATKEELVLGEGDIRDAELLHAIETRPAGTCILEVARQHTLATSRRVRETPAAQRKAFRAIVQSAPSVQARWRDRQRQHEAQLASVLAAQTQAEDDDPTPHIVAGVLGLLQRMAFYEVLGWPDGKARSALKTEQAIDRAYGAISKGLQSYGARPRKA